MTMPFTKAEIDTLHRWGIDTVDELRDACFESGDAYLAQLYMRYLNLMVFARKTEPDEI